MPRLLALIFVCFAFVRSALAADLPAGGVSVFTGSPPAGFSFFGANGTRSVVAVSGIPHAEAWRITTVNDTANRWEIELTGAINRAVDAGDVGLVRFYARRTQATDPLGYAKMAVVVQKNSPNYDKSLTYEISLGADWKEYFVPFKWATAFASGGSALVFDFGYRKQEVELAGVELLYYGKTVTLESLPRTSIGYPGMEDGAAWRTAALARIEANRKGNLEVRVVSDQGTPLSGVSVSVEMVRHHFQFGSAVAFERLLSDTPANRWYQRKFLELFNAASPENDLKWQPLAGDWGPAWTAARAKAGLQWLAQHNIPARGHVMVWPGTRNMPRAINDLIGTSQQNTIQSRVLQHIDFVSELSSGLVEEWDVQNEPYDNKDLMTALGYDITVEWFKRAREKLPGVRLYLNDYANENKYGNLNHINADKQMIELLQSKGAPIDAMGIQAHIGAAGVPPQYLLETLDDFAAYNLDLRITEYDMDTTDEQQQAKFTRDFMIACFSHPRMLGIQFWGFWEEAHWIPNGALYRKDFSEKPVGETVRKLIHDEWRTRFTANTDGSGRVSGRGFYGDYIATIEYGGQKVKRSFSHRPGSPASVEMTVTPPRLGNLSTRGLAGGSKGSLSMGFAIRGTESKQLVIRAASSLLKDVGFSNALTGTRLTVTNITDPDSQKHFVVATNQGWRVGNDVTSMANTFKAVGAFDFPATDVDSALILTLPPGNYTAACDSVSGAEGIGLVEIYETQSTGSYLYNLSTLGYTERGAGALVSGLYVSGRNARTYLIRAVGPTLAAAPFNVGGTLARPTLTLFKGEKALYTNIGWESSPDRDRMKALFPQVGAFDLKEGFADAAMVVTLEPNIPQNYSVQITGVNDTVGKVLLEIYEVRQ